MMISYKQALKIIRIYEQKEDKKFREKELKHLKGFEGKYYRADNTKFERVIKVNNGHFISEIIDFDISIKTFHSYYDIDPSECKLYTLIGGTGASIERDRISENNYNKIRKLAYEVKHKVRSIKTK